ncbi:transporter substrate-binding domain-containing protein, partial [Dialister sp.]
MLGKKLKILLAVGAASAVMLAAGCGGGDSKSSSASGKGGIPAVIRVGSETTFPPFEFTENDKYVGFDLDLADAIIKQMGSKMEFKSMGFDALIPA